MKFYIKELGEWSEKSVLLSPEITTTFDETLDSANVILTSSNQSTPYEPDTLCKFEIDNDILLFIIAVDTVECVSRNPLLYQHHLSLVQNTRLLSKHIVRNTSFSQPARRFEKTWAFRTYLNVTADEHMIRNASFSIKTKLKSKVRGIFKVYHTGSSFTFTKFVGQFGYRTSTMSQESLITFTGSEILRFKFVVDYYDGTQQTYFLSKTVGEFSIGTQFEINIPSVALLHDSPIKNIFVWPDFEGDWEISPTQQILDTYNIGQQNWALHLFCEFDTYNYTMYDIIDTLRKQYAQNTNDYTNSYLFDMPTGELETLLKDTIAPNFTFTGTTMYDCLAEIFKFYDSIFTLDENNILGIEYLNETSKTTIDKNFSNVSISVNEDSYNEGLINTFENSYIEEESIVPVRNSQLGIPSDENNYYFILPHEIHEVLSAEVYIPSGTWGGKSISGQYVDISWFMMEQQLYSLLEQGSSIRKSNTQENTLYFSENKISVGTTQSQWGWGGTYRHLRYVFNNIVALLFDPHSYDSHSIVGITSINFNQTKLKIKYLTRVNGRVRINTNELRYKGEMQVNQGQGSVDTHKLGLNMIGLSMKRGNPTLSMTQQTSSWVNRIKKGDIYTYNGDKYLANTVRYTFFNDYVKTTIEFVKNFNSLSTRVQIDREKRLSNISNNLTVMSEENYNEYVYVGVNSNTLYQTIALTKINKNILYYNIVNTFGVLTTIHNIDFVQITTKYDNLTGVKSGIYMPMIKYALGNTICFECSFDSPISAGNKTTYGNSIKTESTLYTDESGWFDYVTLFFSSYTNSSFGNNFPEIQQSEFTVKGTIVNYQYYKKPNEIFAFNYELQFLPFDKDVFIGSKFIENNSFLKGINLNNFYVYYGEKYDVLDTKGKGTRLSVNNITYEITNNTLIITFTTSRSGLTEGFAICDNDKNIYLATNKQVNTNSVSFSFTCRHNKI